jgi:hypothetical protein
VAIGAVLRVARSATTIAAHRADRSVTTVAAHRADRSVTTVAAHRAERSVTTIAVHRVVRSGPCRVVQVREAAMHPVPAAGAAKTETTIGGRGMTTTGGCGAPMRVVPAVGAATITKTIAGRSATTAVAARPTAIAHCRPMITATTLAVQRATGRHATTVPLAIFIAADQRETTFASHRLARDVTPAGVRRRIASAASVRAPMASALPCA